jgi:DNA-binding MarR family transcriptional regulator
VVRYMLEHLKLSRTNLTNQDYAALVELRYQIRRFVRFSEEVSRNTGLKPQQHQLMLTLKGLPEGTRPCVGEIAQRLQIKHHSTVELIDRLVARGYVRRHRGESDKREVLLTLARKGENVLRKLSLQHLAELRVQGPALVTALERVTKHEWQYVEPHKTREKELKAWQKIGAAAEIRVQPRLEPPEPRLQM